MTDATRITRGAPPFRVVVVGDGLNALGVIRSLALGGIRPVSFTTSSRTPPALSRHCIPHVVPSLAGDALIDALIRLQGSREDPGPERPLLILTEERGVDAVCESYRRLSNHYRLTLNPDVTPALQRKSDFHRLAEQHGERVPRTISIRSTADIAALENLRPPIVLKPAVHSDAYSRHFEKAYRLADLQDAASLCVRTLAHTPEMIAQEWIEGDDSDIYFCLVYIDRNGRLVSAFTGRKLRSWPPRVGGTASCTEAKDVHPELSRRTADFFASTGYFGLASMEFKRDRRDGQFYCVEPTVGRTDFQEEVATLNGENVPLRAYLHERDGTTAMPAQRPCRPVVWFERNALYRALEREPAAGTDGPAGSRHVEATFRWHDIGPFAYPKLERIAQLLRMRTTP